MPNTNIAVGNGSAFVEIQLSLPDQKVLVLSPDAVSCEKADIEESIQKSGRAAFGFRTTQSTYVDTIQRAVAANGTPLIRFRYGIGTADKVAWTPWQLHLILEFHAKPQSIGPTAGHMVSMVTADLLFIIDRSSKTASYRGTVSSIVKAIAQRNGIKDLVVEDTVGEGLWIQSYLGDTEFIRKRLVARARSVRDRGNYFFYAKDNALHFHTVDYQATVRDLAYYSAPGAALTESDLSQRKLDKGASGINLTTHDPYTGLSKELKTSADRATRFAGFIPRLDKVVGADRNMRMHLSSNRPEEAANIAQNAYESARGECFQLNLSMTKAQLIRAGDLLRINLDPTTSKNSSWSGTYLVVQASHTIQKGEIHSVYVLQRGEQASAKNQPNTLADLGVDTVQDDTNAPGYDLNLTEVQASALTRGTGASSKTYLTVQSANTALTPSPASPFTLPS